MYDSKSPHAEEFICDEEILATLEFAKKNKNNKELLQEILQQAEEMKGLSYRQVALLLECDDQQVIDEIHRIAMKIKERIYGNRIVFFAPLYLANYCVNSCRYCGYHHSNCEMKRKKLSQEEIRKEVIALQDMGHKRLALETGEDPVNIPLEYVLESIKTIYSIKHKNGAIRRVNVNIAATTVENYRKLKEAGIGTYILFQETYHKPTYEYMHPAGPKHNYAYHTEAMDRAQQGGIDDVGIGVLYGLYDYKYDTVGMMMHIKHLEDTCGVGPHTISLPRMRFASDVNIGDYQRVPDEVFYNIVAILRCAVPYTGMIISTRESPESREKLLKLGISQLSGGSCTGVGGYADEAQREEDNTAQFEVNDERSLDEIMNSLCRTGYIPSFCTACYREGRTGDRFMQLAKTGQICNVCQPNALMTLKEYVIDYASEETRRFAEELIEKEIPKIKNEKIRAKTIENLKQIEEGKRDFRF
ncbi:[FeFe] hydrogenase H-cluster radical SAM maturase HydG [Massiliimalia timonensis]|uniref:[FeFe] hydrogenase H-cluster radical SAM maturase HydG n=1 Tax=Massiliimalia timonensis TaxID=1987501 RepID=UPI000B8A9052|nr:[FeFe] hydrogenase H-cluster radical SAM maturase HydG [Massiliimalia timonensis]